ncbi:unnamed protein product [Lathyrus oleraceus]
MEKFLSSSSSLNTNLKLKPFSFLSSTTPFRSKTFNFLPSICSSFNHENPSPFLSSASLLAMQPKNSLSRLTDSRSPVIESQPLNHINADADFRKPKGITVQTCVILSTLDVLLIQPVFAPVAFATFQSTAKISGPAIGGKLIHVELLSSAWTCFFVGCLHTLSGPDHLAALAPLSIGRTRTESALVGALWGCARDAGQLIFGLIFLLLKDQLHIEIIQTWGTRVVGITLLVIGAMGIKEASKVSTPAVAVGNSEFDVSVYKSLDNPVVGNKKKIGSATFATGTVHELQPNTNPAGPITKHTKPSPSLLNIKINVINKHTGCSIQQTKP